MGGCDIVMEMYETGELAETLGIEAPEAAGDLTDNDSLKNEGKVDRGVGGVKDKIDDAGDKVKDALS